MSASWAPGCSSSASSSRLRMVETLHVGLRDGRGLGTRRGVGLEGRSLFCLLKLDKEEIYTSTHVAKSTAPVFSDDLVWEVPTQNFRQLHLYVCEQSAGRVPHPFLRLSLKKADIIKLCHNNASGSDTIDRYFRLKPYSRQSEITGKICLEVTTEEVLGDDPTTHLPSVSKRVQIKVLDFAGLSLPSGGSKPVDLYALVTVQSGTRRIKTEKLKIPQGYQRSRRLWESEESFADSPSTSDPPSSAASAPSAPPTLTFSLDPSALPHSHSTPASSAVWRSNQDGSSSPSTSEPPSPCSLEEAGGSRSFPLPPPSARLKEEPLELRISLWHDIGLFNSFFHGQLSIPLSAPKAKTNRSPQWYCLKPRESDKSSGQPSDGVGELRLRISYRVSHILPLWEYSELWESLLSCVPGNGTRVDLSAVGVLGELGGRGMEEVSRPLVRLFLQAEKLRPLLRLLCEQEMDQCADVNTLFRSESLASSAVSQALKLLGQSYLCQTLKPLIERIYAERRSCEIDPARIAAGQTLEENAQNLFQYSQLVFGRVADSHHRCPRELRHILADLRAAARERYPGQAGVEFLAVSSFVIMRFFSTALFDPKHFGLKRDSPEPTVARTLALVSKVLQKLANYVVCGHRLYSKEVWLQPVLDRFMDESHAKSMAKFLELVSEVDGEPSSISSDSVSIVREGALTERGSGDGTRSCWEWAGLRRYPTRHVILTESDLLWGKHKESLSGRIPLEELVELGPVGEEAAGGAKNVFSVASTAASVSLQAASQMESLDWVSAIKRQARRKRSAGGSASRRWEEEVELERELESLHMTLFAHADLLHRWKCVLDGSPHTPDIPPLPKLLAVEAPASPSPDSAAVTLDDVLLSSPALPDEQRAQFRATLDRLLGITFGLETAHTKAIESYFREIKYGSKDLPIGDDNYLLLKSRIKDARGLRKLGAPPLPPRPPSPPAQSPPPLPSRRPL